MKNLTLVGKERDFPRGRSLEEAIAKWKPVQRNLVEDLPLFARHGNMEMVKRALKKRPNGTLMYAAVVEATAFGHVDILKVLIENGADVGIERDPDCLHFEPILIACICNRIDIARLLLDAGADVGASVGYVYPIHCAIANNNLRMVQLLDALGGLVSLNVNLLDLALVLGHAEIAEYLESRGDSVASEKTEWDFPAGSFQFMQETAFESLMDDLQRLVLERDYTYLRFLGLRDRELREECEEQFGES